jgi:hypothetical protein
VKRLAIAPEDADELARLFDGADHIATISPPVERAPELLKRLAPSESPTLVLLFILGYLSRGWLS